MNKILLSLMLALPLVAGTAVAADAKKDAPTAQQSKMGACNKDAGAMKGDERKKFMSDCLKKDAPAAAPAKAMSQQDKMKACNKDATGKKGDERKKFMSDCLKG